MSGTTSMRVGDRGRVVLPVGLRQRRNWTEGTTLIAVETDRGVVLVGRDELEHLLRSQIPGTSLVECLLEERRVAAAGEDAG